MGPAGGPGGAPAGVSASPLSHGSRHIPPPSASLGLALGGACALALAIDVAEGGGQLTASAALALALCAGWLLMGCAAWIVRPSTARAARLLDAACALLLAAHGGASAVVGHAPFATPSDGAAPLWQPLLAPALACALAPMGPRHHAAAAAALVAAHLAAHLASAPPPARGALAPYMHALALAAASAALVGAASAVHARRRAERGESAAAVQPAARAHASASASAESGAAAPSLSPEHRMPPPPHRPTQRLADGGGAPEASRATTGGKGVCAVVSSEDALYVHSRAGAASASPAAGPAPGPPLAGRAAAAAADASQPPPGQASPGGGAPAAPEADAAAASEEAMRSARAGLIRVVCHDLRTPLLAAGSAVSSLQALPGHSRLDAPSAVRAVSSLYACTALMERILGDMLDFERLEAGRLLMRFEPLQLAHLFADGDAAFSGAAGARGVRLCVEPLEERLCRLQLLGDARRLQQTLNHGLSNALKFTPRGGEVRLRATLERLEPAPPDSALLPSGSSGRLPSVTHQPGASRGSPGPAAVGGGATRQLDAAASPADGHAPAPGSPPTPGAGAQQPPQHIAHVRVEVVDTGAGIGPDTLEVLRSADAFAGGAAAAVRAGQMQGKGGAGLGLVVSQRILKLHGNGSCLQLRSDGVGRGATFEMRLGLREATGAALQPGPLSRATSCASVGAFGGGGGGGGAGGARLHGGADPGRTSAGSRAGSVLSPELPAPHGQLGAQPHGRGLHGSNRSLGSAAAAAARAEAAPPPRSRPISRQPTPPSHSATPAHLLAAGAGGGGGDGGPVRLARGGSNSSAAGGGRSFGGGGGGACSGVRSNRPTRGSADSDALSAGTAAGPPLPPGFRVLYVEDDRFLHLTFPARVFSPLGISYDLAVDGAAALRMCEASETEYAAVVMDNQMPVMTGAAATRALREEQGYRGLVIGMTGDPQGSQDRDDFEASGVDVCLDKDVQGMQAAITLLQECARRAAVDAAIDKHMARPLADGGAGSGEEEEEGDEAGELSDIMRPPVSRSASVSAAHAPTPGASWLRGARGVATASASAAAAAAAAAAAIGEAAADGGLDGGASPSVAGARGPARGAQSAPSTCSDGRESQSRGGGGGGGGGAAALDIEVDAMVFRPQPLLLGALFPDFSADSTAGRVRLHGAIDGSWSILFSHPADFTPVCTHELATVVRLMPEFRRRGVKVLAISCHDVRTHRAWARDILAVARAQRAAERLPPTASPAEVAAAWAASGGADGGADADAAEGGGAGGGAFPFPIIADPHRAIAHKLSMVDHTIPHDSQPLTCRAVFIISPDRRLRAQLLYPAVLGRNFDEILRAVDGLQTTTEHDGIGTPANWTPGAQCMLTPALSDEEARARYGAEPATLELPSGLGYMRWTADPAVVARVKAAEGRGGGGAPPSAPASRHTGAKGSTAAEPASSSS